MVITWTPLKLHYELTTGSLAGHNRRWITTCPNKVKNEGMCLRLQKIKDVAVDKHSVSLLTTGNHIQEDNHTVITTL